MLDLGANPDVKDPAGLTAAHLAAWNNDVESLAILKQAGANLNATDNSGRTPLHYAVFYGGYNAVSFLLENNAKEVQDRFGMTALHFAGKKKKTRTFNLLKAYGFKEDVKDNYGKTPLDYFKEKETAKLY